jgi:hypothetical protein
MIKMIIIHQLINFIKFADYFQLKKALIEFLDLICAAFYSILLSLKQIEALK